MYEKLSQQAGFPVTWCHVGAMYLITYHIRKNS